ncbi:MAG: STAS domain-containing protein [Candidatus Margulisbacteria bacterium]|nr:STAS domain-containing protein [Candidatus Margulisiibacteriota bacterium]
MLEIQKEVKNNIVILSLGANKSGNTVSGDVELDVDNNYLLIEAVEEELSKGKNKLILQLKNVSYVDSSGLGAIFDSYKQVVEKDGQLRILNPNIDVKRVLDITKISKKIDIFNNEEEALKSFN